MNVYVQGNGRGILTLIFQNWHEGTEGNPG